MKTIPLENLDSAGWNPEIMQVDSIEEFRPSDELGASRYRHTYMGGCHLDTLLVNKQSDTLIVSLHGALNRSTFSLPRFERLKSLTSLNVSSMYFGDPSLWLDEKLELAWFTGRRTEDVHSDIAAWVLEAARAVRAKKIIISGSSGGGFASLQVSSLIPGSMALAFNPQTSIHGYLINGKPGAHGAERTYMEFVHPECFEGSIWQVDFTQDWTMNLGDEVSVLRRYSRPLKNYVLYCHTVSDWHHEQHLIPFKEVVRNVDMGERLRFLEYGERKGHFPPTAEEFEACMAEALRWFQSL